MNNNNEYSLFKKTKGDKKFWCVYFKDEEGKRLNPIYVSKLKKMVYKGRQRNEPIPLTEDGKNECIRICEKSLNNEKTREYIFRQKEPTSPNFIEMVRKILDYDNSPYIQGRIKENNTINRHSIQGYINSFNEHIVSLIPPTLTLKDIEVSRGGELTKIRDKILNLDISPTIKNKGLQSMRTTLDYCCQRSLINDDYKKRLKNFKVNEVRGQDSLTEEEINKITSYYYKNTKKGYWERYKYLITMLSSTTGLRPSEIMGLKKSDIVGIDKENDCGVLYINHSINCDNEYSTRKNKKSVYVSTYIPLIEEILDFGNSNPTKSEWCFWDINHPENHITKDQFRGIPLSTFNDLEIKKNDRKISFYSLRKTSSTIIGNNKSYKHLKSSSLLGHSSVKVTEDHYIKNTIESSIDNFNDIRQYIKLPS